MTIMEKEILEIPQEIKNSFSYNLDNIKKVAKIIKKYNPSHFVIVARGSSKNAGLYAKYLFETINKISVLEYFPSTTTIYDTIPESGKPFYIFISQGGKGEDLRLVLNKVKEKGFCSLAITNNKLSPLNDNAAYSIVMGYSDEKAMAATKSFTLEMFTLLMLSYELSNLNINELLNIPDLISNTINNNYSEIKKLANNLYNKNPIYILARGYNYPIAKEAVCKMEETCFINAISYAISDFYHGPLALASNSFNALIISINDETKKDSLDIINKLKENNANIFLITDDDNLDYKKVLIDSNKNIFNPFIVITVIQLLCLEITKLKGTNPDTSRNLNKYTITI